MDETVKQDATAEPAAATPQDDLAAAKAQADEYLAGWKRATADYANLKKEIERSQREMAKYAAAGLAEELLPILDSFRKAVGSQPLFVAGVEADGEKCRQWTEGVVHIKTQFESVLKNAGVAAIDTAGVPFDPARHEAMMTEKATKDAPSGSVVRVLEVGYTMYDRVLRPAKVVIAD